MDVVDSMATEGRRRDLQVSAMGCYDTCSEMTYTGEYVRLWGGSDNVCHVGHRDRGKRERWQAMHVLLKNVRSPFLANVFGPSKPYVHS